MKKIMKFKYWWAIAAGLSLGAMIALTLSSCQPTAPAPGAVTPPVPASAPEPKIDWTGHKVQVTKGQAEKTDFTAEGWSDIEMGLRDDGVMVWRVRQSTK